MKWLLIFLTLHLLAAFPSSTTSSVPPTSSLSPRADPLQCPAMSSLFKKAAAAAGSRLAHHTSGSDDAAAVRLDFTRTHETIAGFGGSAAYYTNWLDEHPNRQQIVETIFRELRPSVVRLRNTFACGPDGAPDVTPDMRIDARFVQSGREILGPRSFGVLLTSWSPPPKLKESHQMKGEKNARIIRAPDGKHWAYDQMAQWWLESVRAYEALNVPIRWASLQNEPDYVTGAHECCAFASEETRKEPGYDQLIFATHAKFQKGLKHPPGLIGPEHTKVDGYLPSGKLAAKLEAVGNHLYGSGDFDNPDSLSPSIKTAGRWAAKNTKQLYVTEYAILRDAKQGDEVKLARIIYDALVNGNASMYLQWDLFWGEKTGEGTMVLVGNAWNKAEWTNREGFVLTPSFWYFAHFSRFIRPGMQRVDASSPRGDILACAFADQKSGAIVLISTSHREIRGLRLAGVPGSLMKQKALVYQSTPSSRMQSRGEFNGESVDSIPPYSITTIAFGRL